MGLTRVAGGALARPRASDLACAPTLARDDSESEIQSMLAKERPQSFINVQTALHLAAMQDEYLTRDVLAQGFNINIRNLDGETPLMCAVNIENIGTVALLFVYIVALTSHNFPTWAAPYFVQHSQSSAFMPNGTHPEPIG
jgi:hypothetical protein